MVRESEHINFELAGIHTHTHALVHSDMSFPWVLSQVTAGLDSAFLIHHITHS